jgi:Tol biopolymer transport system component
MNSLGRNLRSLWLLPLLAFCVAIGAREALAQQTPDLVLTKVWEGEEPDFWATHASPDGRYVSEIDWMTGDLAVIDLETGKLKRLTDKGSWLDATEWAETSVFSPDGGQLAYTWWNEEVPGYEIRAMNVDGSNVRTLLPSPGVEFYAMLQDWTEDGRVLAMMWRGEDLFELSLVSAEDGSIQVITAWEDEKHVYPSSAKISPDGRFLAYDPALQTEMEKRDIVVMPVDGGEPVAVVEGPGADLLMGWMPDGRGILFHSDRGLTEGIWMVPVADGRPAGEPTLLKGGVHDVEPLGFAHDAFLFGVTTKMAQVHTAGIDLVANRILTSPAPVEDPSLGQSMDQMWSTDGRYLSYERMGRGQSYFDAELVIRSTEGGEVRILDTPLESMGQHLGWSADGRFLVITGRMTDDTDEPGVFRVDLESGKAEAVLLDDELVGRGPRTFALSPDGTTLYYAGRAEKAEGEAEPDPYRQGPFSLIARNLKDGAEAKIGEIAGLVVVRASPDGSMLALGTREFETRSSALLVVSATGGEVRELYRPEPPLSGANNAIAWTPDSKHLLFQTWNEDTNGSTLWKIAAAGGEPVAVTGTPREMGFGNLQLSPDGTRIAFRGGDWEGEIWKIENLPGTARVSAQTP